VTAIELMYAYGYGLLEYTSSTCLHPQWQLLYDVPVAMVRLSHA